MAGGASKREAVVASVRRHPLTAQLWLAGMVLVALVVQVVVWGAPRDRGGGGSALPHFRHYFSLTYAAVLIGAELLFCVAYRIRRAAVWLLVACAIVDAAFWIAHVAGNHFPTGAAASLTAGAGAVVLAAGVLTGRFPPAAPRRPRTR